MDPSKSLQHTVYIIMYSRRTLTFPLRRLTTAIIIILSMARMSVAATPVSCNVTDASTCTLGTTFLAASGCCQNCSVCPAGTITEVACNTSHNTNCVERPCSDPNTVYRENDGKCVINCTRCSYQCNIGENRCDCNPNICYEDTKFCQGLCLPKTPDIDSNTPPSISPGNPTSLPTWGIGVIAVVAVLGIVAFSAVFLFLGVCTSKRKTEVDSEASDSSSNVLVTGSTVSGGTNLTYLTGFPNHSLIDLLRLNNNPLHDSLNSVRSSPRGARSSPCNTKPVRTEYHLDTKSPVHCSLSNHSSPLPLRILQVKVDKSSMV